MELSNRHRVKAQSNSRIRAGDGGTNNNDPIFANKFTTRDSKAPPHIGMENRCSLYSATPCHVLTERIRSPELRLETAVIKGGMIRLLSTGLPDSIRRPRVRVIITCRTCVDLLGIVPRTFLVFFLVSSRVFELTNSSSSTSLIDPSLRHFPRLEVRGYCCSGRVQSQ